MIMDIPEAQRIQKDFEAKFTEKANRATTNISALKNEKTYLASLLEKKTLCTTHAGARLKC
jgi:hypothetical protein